MESGRKNNMTMHQIYSWCFLSSVFILLAIQLLGKELTFNSISEKFLFRKSLIGIYLQMKYALGDRLFSGIVVGDDGWLFYTRELSLRTFQKIDPLNISNIKKITNIFEQVDEKVKSYGGTFLVVIPPDKNTIYPQYMPEEIPVIGDETSLDRLIERVNKYSDVKLVDLRPALLHASDTSQLYYKTDTHWNCLGAYYAYEEILLSLMDVVPQLKILPIEDFTIVSQERVMDLANTMNLNVTEGYMIAKPNFDVTITTLSDSKWSHLSDSLKVSVNSDDSLPSLMVFHDSFYSVCLSTYVETSFTTTLSVPYDKIKMDQILEMIEAEKPQVVIFQVVERFMDFFLWRFAD